MALLTLDNFLNDYMVETDVAVLSTDEENHYQNMLDAADNYFREVCNRDFETNSYTEKYCGTGTKFMVLKHYPIQSISTVDGYDSANIDIIENGKIYNNTADFVSGQYNIEFTYTAGYSTIPKNIQNAVGLLAMAFHKETKKSDDRLNVFTMDKGDTTKKLNKDVIPPETQQAINKYEDNRKVVIDCL